MMKMLVWLPTVLLLMVWLSMMELLVWLPTTLAADDTGDAIFAAHDAVPAAHDAGDAILAKVAMLFWLPTKLVVLYWLSMHKG